MHHVAMKPNHHRKSSRAGRIFAEGFATAFTVWSNLRGRFATTFTGWSNLCRKVRYCIHGLVESSRKDSLLHSRAGRIFAERFATTITGRADLSGKTRHRHQRNGHTL